jgi:hypothetical protein
LSVPGKDRPRQFEQRLRHLVESDRLGHMFGNP